ncbi:unnamed protein product [Soboliphyme baturini]|uniref:CUB domain-containing protein n=1 Tax=Soboliphyme baturini TaxID=241478 RepID=A0A183I930_9BILA|nr:unnamed protein product [Soboliphyme baturini]
MDRGDSNAMRHMLQLNRTGRSDVLCKLVYSIRLGRNSKCYRFPVREEVFDFGGNGEGLYFEEDYTKYLVDDSLDITIRLYRFSYVSQLKLSVPKPEKKSTSYCFDNEKQTWSVIAELNPKLTSDRLGFTVFYGTSRNIPKNYILFMVWSLALVSSWPSDAKKISLSDKPVERYYSSLQPDKGTTLISKLTAKEISGKENKWIDSTDNKFTVYLEWHCSYALSALSYSVYDDIYRRQYAQMRQEVNALQRENSQLEKELFKYQQCISKKCNQPRETKTHSAQDAKLTVPRRHSSAISDMRNKIPEDRKRTTGINAVRGQPTDLCKLPSPSLNNISKNTLNVPIKPALNTRRHSAADLPSLSKRDLKSQTECDVKENVSRKGTSNVVDSSAFYLNSTCLQRRYGSSIDLSPICNRQSAERPTEEYICRRPLIRCSDGTTYCISNPGKPARCIPNIYSNSRLKSHRTGTPSSYERGGRVYSNPEILAPYQTRPVPKETFLDHTL